MPTTLRRVGRASRLTSRAALALSVLGLSSACTSRTTPITEIRTPRDMGQAEADLPDLYDAPIPQLCRPGQRRCVFESSPIYEQCDEDGQRSSTYACKAGEVCREAQCIPFACSPGRALCLGDRERAVCDPTGRGVREMSTCAEDELCLGGSCVHPCQQAAEGRSYLGCAYTTTELFNQYRLGNRSTDDSPFAIVLGNPSRLTDAWVTLTRTRDGEAAPLLDRITLEPQEGYVNAKPTTLQSAILDQERELPLERDDQQRVRVPAGTNAVLLLQNPLDGPYRITSTQPVAAYQFSPYCCNFTATNDASLLLPDATLGTRYRVVNYPTFTLNGDPDTRTAPYITIVAADQPASVRVRAAAPLGLLSGDNAQRDGDDLVLTLEPGASTTLATLLPRVEDGEKHTFSLDDDLSGAEVISDAPVAVFAGHPCTFIPFDEWACDHLEEQMLPADALGTRYLLTTARQRNPSARSDEAIYWKIVADADAIVSFWPPLDALALTPPSHPAHVDCRTYVNANGLVQLKAGQSCELGTREAVALESSAPVLVGGFLSGHDSTNIGFYGTQSGDPAFFLATPVRQHRNNYTFVTPPTFKRIYAGLAVPAGTQVALNGRGLTNEQKLQVTEAELGAQRWEIFHLALTPGVHTLEASARFGLLVYAYDDYVSYAFAGGLDLVPDIKE